MWTVDFQMFKLDLEKAEEPEIKLPISTGSLKKQESSREALTVWITHQKKKKNNNNNNNLKILKEMAIPDHLICLLRNMYAGQ